MFATFCGCWALFPLLRFEGSVAQFLCSLGNEASFWGWGSRVVQLVMLASVHKGFTFLTNQHFYLIGTI